MNVYLKVQKNNFVDLPAHLRYDKAPLKAFYKPIYKERHQDLIKGDVKYSYTASEKNIAHHGWAMKKIFEFRTS